MVAKPRSRSREHQPRRRGERPRPRPRAAPRVAVIARQGKFLVAEPFFAPGPRMAVSRDSRYEVGDLVDAVLDLGGAVRLVARVGRRGRCERARARAGRDGRGVLRRLGRPDIARDVIEALMIDRGLRGAFDPAVGARGAAAAERELPAEGAVTSASCRRSRSIRSARATSTTRSRPRRGRRRLARVGPHRRRAAFMCRRGRWSTVRPIGGDQRVRARGGRADAAGVAVQRRLLAGARRGCGSAVTVEMVDRGAGRDARSFYRSVIRSDERLDYDRVDRIFAGAEAAAEPWGEPLAAARGGGRGARRAAARRSAVVLRMRRAGVPLRPRAAT